MSETAARLRIALLVLVVGCVAFFYYWKGSERTMAYRREIVSKDMMRVTYHCTAENLCYWIEFPKGMPYTDTNMEKGVPDDSFERKGLFVNRTVMNGVWVNGTWTPLPSKTGGYRIQWDPDSSRASFEEVATAAR